MRKAVCGPIRGDMCCNRLILFIVDIVCAWCLVLNHNIRGGVAMISKVLW